LLEKALLAVRPLVWDKDALCTNLMEVELEFMVRVRVAVPVPIAFVAFRVTVEIPVALGVPEITPVAVLTDNPAGNPVAPKLVGVLEAVI
jgi:hypothetical protein